MLTACHFVHSQSGYLSENLRKDIKFGFNLKQLDVFKNYKKITVDTFFLTR